ncbi:hypothetical protein COCNU_scaffold004575G000050 [Cocos nucifera]|nr:hypothetical protein [Cocos nucifera]
MKDIRLRDLPSFIRTTDPDDFLLQTEMEETNNTFRFWGLILNTFDHMECNVLDALKCMFPRMYTIGPLSALLNQTTKNQWNSMRLSLWEEDYDCLQWLETQRAASVIYVNFGSLTTMTVEQLIEFAWGIADSNHPFLWIIRHDLVAGGLEALPEEFIIETKDRSFLTSWRPQQEVLSHPAIGGFLTHSDQYTNARFADKKWEIGLEIDQEVKREQVRGMVREVMERERGKEMRKNAMKWKEMAEQATRQGGSSYENIERLAQDLNQFTTMRTEQLRYIGTMVHCSRGILRLDKSCITNGYLDTSIDWIQGMKGIRLGDISSFVGTVNRDDMFLKLDMEKASNSFRAGD